jgi:molybdopterin molybdotransferase
MLSVAETQKVILEQAQPLPPTACALEESVLGRVLAEDVASDLDMPPFDKSLMDGYAVRSADFDQGPTTLTVIEEVAAGQTPRRPIEAGQATRIMTGAPLPAGSDAVVMIEQSRAAGEGRVHLDDQPRREQNILRRGREMRAGEVVLKTGQMLRPQEIGLLASVGRSEVRVFLPPSVAILPTGDELVDVAEKPAAGQIRNSNGAMLLAQAQRAGADARLMETARDRLDSLRPLVEEGLREADVLVLTGGVSAGKLDLVPDVLAELGVQILVHKVAMKPGKPMLFGFRKNAAQTLGWRSAQTLVFGLPGNPVSSWVCFELFVAPALRRLAGVADAEPRWIKAALEVDFAYRTSQPTYHPARIWLDEGVVRFRPVPWFGSADLAGISKANGFALFPVGDHHHRAGQVFSVLGEL